MLVKYLKYLKSKRLSLAGGTFFIALGLIIGGLVWLNVSRGQHSLSKPQPLSQVLNNNKPKDDGQPLIGGTPVHISIPSVAIDLKIIPGYYYPATKSWTLSLNDAQYATMTAEANNKQGGTFIYAHYRKGVFYTLHKVLPGAEAVITTDTGHSFTYTFSSSTITTPENTSLFNYKGKPILILQTCTGQWYQNRQLFVFNLTKVG